VHICALSSQPIFLGHNLRLANTELFGNWSSGEIKQAIFDRLRTSIAGSHAYEDVLKTQSEASFKRKYSTWLNPTLGFV